LVWALSTIWTMPSTTDSASMVSSVVMVRNLLARCALIESLMIAGLLDQAGQ
jgi:hypothetical protein